MDDLDSESAAQGSDPQRQDGAGEFGLAQDEIVRAIRAGKLHYREGSLYGEPLAAASPARSGSADQTRTMVTGI